jgi:hypothetical protein
MFLVYELEMDMMSVLQFPPETQFQKQQVQDGSPEDNAYMELQEMRHAGAHSISQQHYALSSLQQGNVSD